MTDARVATWRERSAALLHRLNNQLGVILAHAELLETKAQDAAQKARASQVVSGGAPGDGRLARTARRSVADPK